MNCSTNSDTVSPSTLHFHILGEVMGKPRMTRRDKWRMRPCVMRYRRWCDRVRAGVGTIPPADTVEALHWLAVIAMPKRWPKKKRDAMSGQLCRAKPDKDNIEKGLMDCLWPKGDSAIAAGSGAKIWGVEPSLYVDIVCKP